MSILRIDGNPAKIIESLFSKSEEGFIEFGLTAKSLEPSNLKQLESETIWFRDYIMEGGVSFGLSLQRIPNGLQITLELLGGNRDQYIIPHIKFYVSQADYEAVEAQSA